MSWVSEHRGPREEKRWEALGIVVCVPGPKGPTVSWRRHTGRISALGGSSVREGLLFLKLNGISDRHIINTEVGEDSGNFFK